MEKQEMIEKIIQRTGWTQEELGLRIGVSQAQVSQVLGGKSKIAAKTEQKLSEVFSWITRGEFRLVGHVEGGGDCWIQLEPFLHGASNLSQAQYQAFPKAVRAADPANGQEMGKAKAILTKAGFEIVFE